MGLGLGAAPMSSMTARGATLLILLLGGLLALRFWGEEARGNRAYRDGDFPTAVQRYRAALLRGRSTPRLEYNLGTALFQLGEAEEAQRLLEGTLRAQSPELRARAFYNLGNVLAQSGTVTAERLRAAIAAYRRTLLLEPERAGARWNLELAMRRLQELEDRRQPLAGPEQRPRVPPRAAGAGEDRRPQEGAGEAAIPRPGPAQRETGAAEDLAEPPFPLELAEQILRAVEERERSLQREKLRRRRGGASGPDW